MKNGLPDSRNRLLVIAFVLSLMWLPGLCDAVLPKGKLIHDDLDWLYTVGEERVLLSRKEIAILKNAESGNVTSQYEFAEVLNPQVGEGDKTVSPRIATEAFAWAMCSARRGYAGGENFVGLCYTFGNGVESNVNEGVRYLKRALRHGFPNAKLSLAKHYMETGNFEEALSWAQKSADEGDSGGMRLIGSIYIRDDKATANKQLGVAWLQKSIENGDPAAMNLLADCYLRGNGVASNQWEAVHLYELAAEQTNSFRQATLARVGLFNIYSAQGTANPESRRLAVNAARSVLRRGDEEFLAQLGVTDSLKSYVEKNSKNNLLELGEAGEIGKKLMKIKYGGRKECTMCRGAGAIIEKKPIECPKCNGKGQVDLLVNCGNCKGTGFIIVKCGSCEGRGKIKRTPPDSRKLDPYIKCKKCAAKGRLNKQCPKCLGKKKVDKAHTCDTCNGKRKVVKNITRKCVECKYVYARQCLSRLGYDADFSSGKLREVSDGYNGIRFLYGLKDDPSYTYDISAGNVALRLKGPDSEKIEIRYEIYTGEVLCSTKILPHDSAFWMIYYRWIIDLYEFANDSRVVGKGVSYEDEEDDDKIEMDTQERENSMQNEDASAPKDANEQTSGNSETDNQKQIVEKRMKGIILPSISFRPPATIADAVDYFKQAFRDYDRSDIPKDQRGLNIVLDIKTCDGELPLIPKTQEKNISLWDALDLVCRKIKFKFQIIGGSLVMVMPEGMIADNWPRLVIDSDADLPRAKMLEKRMKAIILPSISFRPPATIADAVEYFKEVSRDHERKDIAGEQRGLNFVLNYLDRTPTSDEELPFVPAIVAKNISLWDALNMVCYVTKFVFKDSEDSIVVMPENMISEDFDSIQEILQSAEQGDAEAQCYLGFHYAKGEGVEKDYNEAVNWFRKAAAQENAEAQFGLGICYNEGKGVKEDKTEAVRWYYKAAEHGLDAAQYNLGLCYGNGEGVEQDYTEAARWLRKAAEQGHSKARKCLKVLETMKSRSDDISPQMRSEHSEQMPFEARAPISYAGNPLHRWQLGAYVENEIGLVRLTSFHGFEKISFGCTSKNRLWSICMTASKSSDSMVRALIRECDSCYPGIEWDVDKNYRGELFAMGRKRDLHGQIDLFVAIVPQPSKSDARIQANIINYNIQRTDDGDEEYRRFMEMDRQREKKCEMSEEAINKRERTFSGENRGFTKRQRYGLPR